MSDRTIRERPRRRVMEVISSHLSSWGGKRYWRLRLDCGHKVSTRNNACQRTPKTAGCEDCRRAARSAHADAPKGENS
jgi:hypothetical protein